LHSRAIDCLGERFPVSVVPALAIRCEFPEVPTPASPEMFGVHCQALCTLSIALHLFRYFICQSERDTVEIFAHNLQSIQPNHFPSLAAPSVTASAKPSEAGSIPDSSVTVTSSCASEMVVPAPSSEGFGQANITSESDSAEIYVDGKFLGNTPATLRLAAGSHAILLKSAGLPDYMRTLDVPKSSKLTLKPSFESKTSQQ
jgi:hypothetical protein